MSKKQPEHIGQAAERIREKIEAPVLSPVYFEWLLKVLYQSWKDKGNIHTLPLFCRAFWAGFVLPILTILRFIQWVSAISVIAHFVGTSLFSNSQNPIHPATNSG